MRATTSIKRPRAAAWGESGFSLVETVVALAILMIALLGMAASIAHGLSMSKKLREMSDSKMTITSMLEQMETLRNTKRLTFGQLANAGQVNNVGSTQDFNGFPVGFQPVSSSPGQDGIYGTADDLIDHGPDMQFGTADDFVNNALARPQYEREIVITSLGTNLKKVQVTMRFPGADGRQQTLVGTSYLNNDANSNFR